MEWEKGDVSIGRFWDNGKDLIYLPQRLGEWVIGDIGDAEEMIKNLQAAIQELKRRKEK